jgi:hypothetical protein
MTHIEDTAISRLPLAGPDLRLAVGVDVRFTGVDLFEGQTGAAQFSVACTIWDEDSVFDDRVTMGTHVMEPGSILEVTGFEMIFDLPIEELKELENETEPFIELFGMLTLRKDAFRQGSSVKTGTIKARIR